MNVDQSLRSLRLVHLMMLVVIPFYALGGEMAAGDEPADPAFLVKAFAVSAVMLVLVALVVRSRMVGSSANQLRTRAADSEALGRWRAGNIVSFVLAEAVALHGLALRMMGASRTDAAMFLGGGFLLLLIWTPRRPG